MAVELNVTQNVQNLLNPEQAGNPASAPISSAPSARTAPVDVGGAINPTVDGMQASNVGRTALATTGASAAGSSAVPALPMQPNAASADKAGQVVSGFSGGFSQIAAFQLIMDAAGKSQTGLAAANKGLMEAAMDAQLAGAKEAVNKAEGMAKSALITLMGSVAGAGLTAGFAAKGASVGSKSAGISTPPAHGAKTAATPPSGNTPKINDSDQLQALEAKKQALAQSAKSVLPQEKAKTSSSSPLPSPLTVAPSGPPSQVGRPTDAASPDHAQLPEASGTANSVYLQSASQIGAVGSGLAGAYDQNLGGQKEVNEADIASKYDDTLQTQYKQVQEGNKATMEKTAKSVDDAIAALGKHYDLVKSTNDSTNR